MKKRRIYIFSFIMILCIVMSIWFNFDRFSQLFHYFHVKNFHTQIQKDHLAQSHSDPWMTVFVHGSFGSVLGFLSFSGVFQDDLEGTAYRNVTRKMRYDSFFYRDQPMLEKGLISVVPTFDLHVVNQKKYAAYPLLKAYETILEQTPLNKEKNYFYTFGWSGLISQQRRRLEAIRLYNALHDELEKFHQQGIYPKVRLIAYSHGGNLCLNLAAVESVLSVKNVIKPSFLTEQDNKSESLKKMFTLLKQLPRKEDAQKLIGQKVFGYVPVKKQLMVDELILFGTPLQPETECFFLSNVFKKIYHFYSDEDIIQRLDWVTTKQRFSNQRLKKEIIGDQCALGKIAQIKIMYDRNLNTQQGSYAKIGASDDDETEKSLWQRIVSWSNSFTKKSNDPTHKKLWFFSWEDQQSEIHRLSPLPTVMLTPLFLVLMQKEFRSKKIIDVDINIGINEKDLELSVLGHNEFTIQSKLSLDMTFIEFIKDKLKPWKPDDTTNEPSVHTLYRHLL